MTDQWIVIPNWDKYQHYRDRNAPWIKLYAELSGRHEWLQLTLAERGLLTTIWVAYLRANGQLTTRDVYRQCQPRATRKQFDALNHAGFITLRASKPLAVHAHAREGEGEGEGETPKPPFKRKPKTRRREEATRRRATAWIDHVAPQLGDVDLERVIADEFDVDDPDLLGDLVAYASERTASR